MPFGVSRHTLLATAGASGSTTGQGTPGDGSTPTSISNWSYTARSLVTISSVDAFGPDCISYGKNNYNPEPYGVLYGDQLSTVASAETIRMRLANIGVGTGTSVQDTETVTTTNATPWKVAENRMLLTTWGDTVSGNWNGRGAVFWDAQPQSGFSGSWQGGTEGRSVAISSTAIQINSQNPDYSEQRLIGATATGSSGGEIDLWTYDDNNNPTIRVQRYEQTGDNDNYLSGTADSTQQVAGEPNAYYENTVAALSAGYSSMLTVTQNAYERDVLLAYDGTNIIKQANIFDYNALKSDTTGDRYTGRLINEGGFDTTNQRGVMGYYDSSTLKLDLIAYNVTTSINTGSKYTVTLPTGADNVGIAYGTYSGYGTLYYNVGTSVYLRKMTVNSSNQISLSSAYQVSTTLSTIEKVAVAQQLDTGGESTTAGNTALVVAYDGSQLRCHGFTFT